MSLFKYQKYCLYHPGSKTFLSKESIKKYLSFDGSKVPSYLDTYYGKLTLRVVEAYKANTQEELKEYYKTYIDKCGYLYLPNCEAVHLHVTINPRALEIKPISLTYETGEGVYSIQ